MPRPEDKPHPVFEDRPGKGKGDPDHGTQPNKPEKEEEAEVLPVEPELPVDPNAPKPDQTLPSDLPLP